MNQKYLWLVGICSIYQLAATDFDGFVRHFD